MRKDDDFEGIAKASLQFADLLEQLLTPLDKHCASFRTILGMPVMEMAQETIIVNGREELRGLKIIIDTVALLGARKESAKLTQQQEETNARAEKLTRTVVDLGVHLRQRQPRAEAHPLFNEPSSDSDDAASHTPVELARAHGTEGGPTPMRTTENSLAERFSLHASLAVATPPRRQESGSALRTPPRRMRAVIEDDSSDDIFTDEAGSPRQAEGHQSPPRYDVDDPEEPQMPPPDEEDGAAEPHPPAHDGGNDAEVPPPDPAPPQLAGEEWRDYLLQPQAGVFRCIHPDCTVPGGYQYGHRWTVIRHIKGHTGEDNLQCRFCDLRVRKKYLNGHISTAHPNAQ